MSMPESVPRQLFHYTNQAGLLGMVETKRMWASNIWYLNDLTESQLAVDLLTRRCGHFAKLERDDRTRAWLEQLPKSAAQVARSHVYVLCFSELSDSLNQWRAYGPGGGFSVGFHTSDLLAWGDKLNWTLVKCEYDPSSQKALVDGFLKESATDFHGKLGSTDVQAVDQILKDHCVRTALTYRQLGAKLKHRSFAEEREWRLISPILRIDEPGCNVRAGRTMLVPYFEFPIVNEEGAVQLSGVTIGPGTVHATPTEDTMRASNSVGCLMSIHNVNYGQLSHSIAPYRGW